MDTAAALYLDLMKKCLTNTLYADEELVALAPRSFPKKLVVKGVERLGLRLARARTATIEARAKGLDNNPRAHTMIGVERLNNIQHCGETVLAQGIPGDFIEAGVWRGGATAFMRAILKAHDVTDRIVWVADSFAGLPPPDEERYPQDKGDAHHTHEWLAISLEDVKETFRRYDLLDEQVRFLEGWFKDTLPHADFGRLALIRLDGDMYESTLDALESLYPKLSIGGFIILDDWNLIPACRQAVDDFRSRHGVTERVMPVDGNAGYWRRER